MKINCKVNEESFSSSERPQSITEQSLKGSEGHPQRLYPIYGVSLDKSLNLPSSLSPAVIIFIPRISEESCQHPY